MFINISTYLICSLLLTGFAAATIDQNIYIKDNKSYTWNSLNYPEPYPSTSQSLSITVDSSYSVLITINDLNLDSDQGDFLLLKAGFTLNDNSEGKIFVYNLKKIRKYLIHSENVFLSFHVFGQNKLNKNGFSIVYQRIGEEGAMSTETPVTEAIWPTPSSSDSIYFISYVAGKTQEDYKNNETLHNLKKAIAEMASQYCAVENILLKENITVANVHMYLLTQCPYNWPNSERCAKISFALPVILENPTEYQLKSEHLEQMWTKFAKLYLGKYNFYLYNIPNTKMSLTIWLATSSIVLLLFLIMLYFTKRVSEKLFTSPGKRRTSDATNIMHDSTVQVIPPFFDNGYGFDQFEPEIKVPRSNFVTSIDNDYPLSEEDDDIEIVFRTFNKNRNDSIESNKHETMT